MCFNFDDEGQFDYLSGVAVDSQAKTPTGLERQTVPAQKYAVFHHAGHISEIRSVIAAIWSVGLPESGHEPVQGAMLEKYGPEFDGRTGRGGFEILIPVR
ncbi:MAG: GyrI-like domain-containing protein [Planctomycetaceae bacterium]